MTAGHPEEDRTLLLHAEQAAVSRRMVVRTVQVQRRTRTRDEQVQAALTHTKVEVEHVPVGRFVDAVPPTRVENGVTILPVMEEVLVVERRLRLVEEVRIRPVQFTTDHAETVTLREQDVLVTWSDPAPDAGADALPTDPSARSDPMPDDTIVAVYDTASHAEQAVKALLAAKVPESAIHRHASEGSYAGSGTSATARPGDAKGGGFWSNLLGGSTEDHSVYDSSMEGGGTVVSVSGVPERDHEAVIGILEQHNPVDIDERAASLGTGTGMGMAGSGAATGMTGTAGTANTSGAAGQEPSYAPAMQTLEGNRTNAVATPPASATAAGGTGEVIPLAEESIAVGKRVVNHGGTRVRRYVVEKPFEQSVSLHEEKVQLERHPVSDGRPVGEGAFTDKTIEMTETAEEAVVSKTARVVEEVALNKTATDREQTVRDTVRKEEVEVEQIPAKDARTKPM